MEILSFVIFYFCVAFGVLIVNAILAGYYGTQTSFNDIIASLFWPVSVASLIGLLIKIGVEAYKEEQQKPKVTPKKKETK
jgi:ABC-type thiamin/hydroxymethylpyrimidine transport system permease subunit